VDTKSLTNKVNSHRLNNKFCFIDFKKKKLGKGRHMSNLRAFWRVKIKKVAVLHVSMLLHFDQIQIHVVLCWPDSGIVEGLKES